MELFPRRWNLYHNSAKIHANSLSWTGWWVDILGFIDSYKFIFLNALRYCGLQANGESSESN